MFWTTFSLGLTNAAAGMCCAILDHSPALFESVQVPRDQLQFNLTHQCIDNLAFAHSLTKGMTEITTPLSLQTEIKRLLELCHEGLPGLVYVSLPFDVLKLDVLDDTADTILSNMCIAYHQHRPLPDPAAMQAIASAITASHYPMVVVGNQVIRDNKIEEAMILIEYLQATVIC